MIECSAKASRGVNESFTEAARVALATKLHSDTAHGQQRSCIVS